VLEGVANPLVDEIIAEPEEMELVQAVIDRTAAGSKHLQQPGCVGGVFSPEGPDGHLAHRHSEHTALDHQLGVEAVVVGIQLIRHSLDRTHRIQPKTRVVIPQPQPQ